MDRAPVTAPAGRPSLLARVLLAAGNPLDWGTADKVMLAALAVLPFTVWYWAVEYIAFTRRTLAPYVDTEFLPLALAAQTGFVIAWTGIAVAAFALRRHPHYAGVLTLALVETYCVGFGLASYYVGHYTAPFGAVVGLAGVIVAILVFEQRTANVAIASFITVLGVTTAAEQLGFIPYAPLFRDSPVQSGHLAPLYLLFHGIPMFGVFAVGAILAYYIVDRWRDRDAKIEQTSEQLARANDVISRYVASQIAQQILAGNHAFLDRHERRRLTLFFSDIKDFAEIADREEPEDLSAVLNEYLAEMAHIAERHGGTIDKFVGDAVMVVFGAPVATDDRDHAVRAVLMAIEMQARITILYEKWAHAGFQRAFEVRMGINTGHATIGSFGSRARLDYTAIGRQVNLAARLQTRCDPGRILISHSTWALVHDAIPCEPKGEMHVKGFQNPVKVYEVIDREAAAASASR